MTSDSFMHLFIIAEGFFVYICICFCFPHLLTMCPPSAKTHESIVTLITPSREFTISEDFSRFARVPNVSPPQRSISSRQAEGLHRRALEGSESQLGPQHPNTLHSANNLANLLYKQGKLEEARPRSLGCRGVAFLALSRGRHFSCGQDETGEFSFPSFTGAIWECELMPRLMYGQTLI